MSYHLFLPEPALLMFFYKIREGGAAEVRGEVKADPVLVKCLNDNIQGVMMQIKKAKEANDPEKLKCYKYHLSILNEKLIGLLEGSQISRR